MRCALTICSLLLAVSAVAGPPRGLRTRRTVATHVVLTKTTLKSGGTEVTVYAGAQVHAARPSGRPLRGRVVVVRTIGSVRVKGTLDAKALGLFVQTDTDLKTASGKNVLGTARAGGLVRVIPGKTIKGYVLIETTGTVVTKALIKNTSLSPHKRELVLAGDYGLVALGVVKLMKAPNSGSQVLATLSPYAKLTPLDRKATYYKVRTFGAFVLEGYVDQGDLVRRAEIKPQPSEPSLLTPTHEVFVRTTIYSDPMPGALASFGVVRWSREGQ